MAAVAVALSAPSALPSVAALRSSGAGSLFLRPSRRSPSGWVAVVAPAAPSRLVFLGGVVVVPRAAAAAVGSPSASAWSAAGAASWVGSFARWWAARLPAACAGVVVRSGLVSVPVAVGGAPC